MTELQANLHDSRLTIDLEQDAFVNIVQRVLEDYEWDDDIHNALERFDIADKITGELNDHDFDQVVGETLERHNFEEYKNAVDETQRKCEVLRIDQEHIITALDAIPGTLDYMLASIQPLNAHQIRAQRVQDLMLKMNESDAQSCLEYCKAALEMTRIDNS